MKKFKSVPFAEFLTVALALASTSPLWAEDQPDGSGPDYVDTTAVAKNLENPTGGELNYSPAPGTFLAKFTSGEGFSSASAASCVADVTQAKPDLSLGTQGDGGSASGAAR